MKKMVLNSVFGSEKGFLGKESKKFCANFLIAGVLFVLLIMSAEAQSKILIVNDNDGAYVQGDSSAMDFFNALSGTYNVTLWNQSINGSPTLAQLQSYDVVIWTTGDYWKWAVSASDATLLRNYVTNGTSRLLLEGGDIAYDHRFYGDTFMTNVAHAVLFRDFSNKFGRTNINITNTAHPVTAGLPQVMRLTADSYFPDRVTPSNGGLGIANYLQYPGEGSASIVVYDGYSNNPSSRVIYLPFSIDGLNDTNKNTLINNSINWLDNCLPESNPDQNDSDGDFIGDICDNFTCLDKDNDTYGVGANCSGSDCNDNDPAVHDNQTYFRDSDGDNYGNRTNNISVCSSAPPSLYVDNNTDCDDNNWLIHPNGREICNGIDDDCDGFIDEGLDNHTYYRDFDADRFGNRTNNFTNCTETAPSGYLENISSDCNDNNSNIHPGAAEICNVIDDDCNGSIDEGLTTYTYYRDADNDTFGNCTNNITICNPTHPTPPSGYVLNCSDCNDSRANSSDTDTDGIPDDCDNCPNTYNNLQTDSDSDGVGDVCDNCDQNFKRNCNSLLTCYNPPQTDSDGDGDGDTCDPCTDPDHDGAGLNATPNGCVNGTPDNCPNLWNPDQKDTDRDTIGDACDNHTEICFDFGTQQPSDLCAGYLNVTNTTLYPGALGYGWENITGLEALDRAGPDCLRRDFVKCNYSSANCRFATFSVDLPNATYNVNMTIGDNTTARGPMNVTVEGTVVVDSLQTAAGNFTDVYFDVNLADGQMNFMFNDGQGNAWVINGICLTLCNDDDNDGICDNVDNCLGVPNTDQRDDDFDGIGNACDNCTDFDGDGFGDSGDISGCNNTLLIDNCPTIRNDQANSDLDEFGDACDNCWNVDNRGQEDSDGDCPAIGAGYASDPVCGDECDNCPFVNSTDKNDTDRDGIGDICDNCTDVDVDGYGNASFNYSGCDIDCDDNDNNTYPRAGEICDGKINDCYEWNVSPWFGNGILPANETDADGDGFMICEGDCDDADNTTYPRAPEICDGKDNQCPGDSGYNLTDEGEVCKPTILIVDDNDGTGLPPNNPQCDIGSSAQDFFDILVNSGLYDVEMWDITKNGSPTFNYMREHTIVIWTSGDYFDNSIDPADRALLVQYANSTNSKLIVEGGDIVWQLRNGDPEGFQNNVIHATFASDIFNGNGDNFIATAINHPITSGLPLSIRINCSSFYPDNAQETNGGPNGGQKIMSWQWNRNWIPNPMASVVAFEGDGGTPQPPKTVYIAFSIDGMTAGMNTLVLNSVLWLLNKTDTDGDGIFNENDNCPNVPNPGQEDADDDGVGDACDNCTDFDRDGYGVCPKCGIANGCQFNGNDCNDNNSNIHPGATEICNGIDDDCDSSIDEGLTMYTYYRDADNDTFGNCTNNITICNTTTPLGYVRNCSDCNDSNPNVKSTAAEICNGIDDNCNEQIDEGCDDDKDNYSDSAMTCSGNFRDGNGILRSCTTNENDCNDSNATIHPNALGICGNEIDEDCNGADMPCACVDSDSDTFNGYHPSACPNGTDCNDNDNTVYPGAPELCDGKDNNCDRIIDEGCDDDNDDWCDAAMTTIGTPPVCPHGGGDCNDNNAAVNPGATEICDNIDNNCTAGIDEGCDDDNDNWCDAAMTTIGTPLVCPHGGGDCNDSDFNTCPNCTNGCGPRILIVNDNMGKFDWTCTGCPAADSSAQDLFDAINGYNNGTDTYSAVVINTSSRTLTPAELQGYVAVIWSGGDSYDDVINQTEATLLTDYVNGPRGRLMLEGWGIGFDSTGAPAWYGTFMNNVVHANRGPGSGTSPADTIIRTRETNPAVEPPTYHHPITQTLSWCKVDVSTNTAYVTYMNLTNGGDWTMDDGHTTGPASLCRRNETGYITGGSPVMITYSNATAKTVYLSLAYDGVGTNVNERDELMENIVDWLAA